MTGQCQPDECYVCVVRPDNSTIWLQPCVSRTLQATTLHPKCCHGLWHEDFSIGKAQQLGINRFRNDHSFHKGQWRSSKGIGLWHSSEWMTNSCETVDAVSTAVARLITRHLRIPNECLSLVWSKPQYHQVIVTIVLTPLSEHDYAMLQDDADSAGGWACLVCCQPCHDADDDDTRELNCVECCPCFLCDRCRVTTPSGASMCDR